MAKGIVDFKIKVDSKGAVKEIRLLGGSMKKASKDQTNWVKAGALASLGAKGLNVAIAGLKKAFMALLGPIKDSIFEIGTLGDRIAKQARMIGVTAEEFQVLEFAATRSGTSVTAVANGMKKLGRVMVDAQNGSRQIKDTFEALEIELKKTDGTLRNSFDVFKDLADKSMILGESAERTGVQMLLLGRSGTELSNLMSQGAGGIEEMKGELVDLGAIMDETQTAMGEDFVDRMADLEFAFRGVKIQLGEHLLPEFINFVEEFTKWVSSTDFSRVADLAADFFDVAMGAARAADELLNLKLFGETDTDHLQKIEHRAEGITDRLIAGTATLYDFRRAQEELATSVDVTDGGMLRWGATLESGGDKLGDFVTNLDDLSFHQLPYANAELLTMSSTFQLSTEQIEEFLQHLDAGIPVEQAAGAMSTLGSATAEQAMMLQFLNRTTNEGLAAERELQRLQGEGIAAGKREQALLEKREELIANEQTATRRRIASLGLSREAKIKDAAASRELSAAEKKLQDTFARLAQEARRAEAALEGLHEEFFREDADQLMADFEAGVISQFEFTMKMEKATTEAVLAEHIRRIEIINEARAAGAGNELDHAIAENQVRLDNEQLRRDMTRETYALIEQLEMERQEKELAFMTASLQASSDFFGALGQIASAEAAKGNKKAAIAAKALFMIQKSLALGAAIVATAQSVATALAVFPGVPWTIPNATIAGVMGATQIATIVGSTIAGVADAGLTSETLKRAGLNQHSAIAVRNDEMVLDPVGTKHITQMLEMVKFQMLIGNYGEARRISLEIDGLVLGEVVDDRLIRQQERGLAYSNNVRQQYEAI